MTTSRRRLECLAAVQASSLGFGEPSAHPKREGHSRHTSHARECKDKPCEHLRGDRLLDRLSSRGANTSLHSESRERKALPSQSDPDSSTPRISEPSQSRSLRPGSNLNSEHSRERSFQSLRWARLGPTGAPGYLAGGEHGSVQLQAREQHFHIMVNFTYL